MAMISPILVAGIGNEFRGDDAAGLLVARDIQNRTLGGVHTVMLSDNLDKILDLWEGATLAIVVDAVRTGAEPGTIISYDLLTDPLPSGMTTTSTHSLDPLQLVKMAQLLNRVPQRLYLVGIEGSNFAIGAEMTEAVQAALPRATEKILALFLEAGIE